MSIINLTNNSINKGLYITINEFVFKLLDSKNGEWLSAGPFNMVKDYLYYPGLYNNIDINTYILGTTIMDQWIDAIIKNSEYIKLNIISECDKELHNNLVNEYRLKIKCKLYSYTNNNIDKYMITHQIWIK